MKKRRHKLRLRKQVIISIPILLLVILTTTILVLNNKKIFTEIEPTTNMNSLINNDEYPIENLSEIIKLNDFKNYLEKRQKDNTIIYYASKFKLDIDETLEIAHKLTNNYEDENYLKTFVIALPKQVEKIGKFNSFEAGVVYFVRDIYRYPNRYDTTVEEIRKDDTITTEKNIINKTIYLSNGLTFEQYVGKIADLFGVEKSIALAICYQESGIMTSKLFYNKNNIGGMKGYDGWMSFTTLEAGIISHILTVKNLVDKYEIDMNSEDAIAKLSGIYVNGKFDSYAESWATKVTYFRNKINEKDLFST